MFVQGDGRACHVVKSIAIVANDELVLTWLMLCNVIVPKAYFQDFLKINKQTIVIGRLLLVGSKDLDGGESADVVGASDGLVGSHVDSSDLNIRNLIVKIL